MAFFHILLLFLFILSSCTKTHIEEEFCGAEEFVFDSYKIREGKLSILEMEGVILDDLEVDLSEIPGEVTLIGKGKVPVNGKTRLADVLESTPISQVNLFKSYIARNKKPLSVDFGKLFVEGDLSQNIVLQNGDLIYLAEMSSASCLVVGEDRFQKVVFLQNGSLPLRKALFEQGSLPFLNTSSKIQVVRGALPKPKVYSLEWEHIQLLPDNSLLVMPGDVIYISSGPASKWHSFISGLLPINRKTD